MSEHLKAADRYLTDAMLFRGPKETWHTNIENSVGMLLRHLEEQQNHQHEYIHNLRRPLTSGPLSPATTPSVTSSLTVNGQPLPAFDTEKVGDWLRQCPLPMTMDGSSFTVLFGSPILWRWDGDGIHMTRHGTLAPQPTSGSAPEEAGARGQAPAAAEPATLSSNESSEWKRCEMHLCHMASRCKFSPCTLHPSASGAPGTDAAATPSQAGRSGHIPAYPPYGYRGEDPDAPSPADYGFDVPMADVNPVTIQEPLAIREAARDPSFVTEPERWDVQVKIPPPNTQDAAPSVSSESSEPIETLISPEEAAQMFYGHTAAAQLHGEELGRMQAERRNRHEAAPTPEPTQDAQPSAEVCTCPVVHRMNETRKLPINSVYDWAAVGPHHIEAVCLLWDEAVR